jgi:hypothetical protein
MEAYKRNFANDSDLMSIKSYKVDDTDLIKDLEISEPTLRSYKKEKDLKERVRISEPRMKLSTLRKALEMINRLGYEKEFETFKALKFEGEPITKFMNQNATNPLMEKLVLLLIKNELKNRSTKKSIDIYRDKYQLLNDDTLSVASKDDPEMLIALILDTELRPSTRGDIIEALADNTRDEYFEFVKEQTTSVSPHVREGSFRGLYRYYIHDTKYSFLKVFFKDCLLVEKAEGVKQTLNELIEEM